MPAPESSPDQDEETDATESVSWKSLSIFLEDAVEDDYLEFFITLRANHTEVRDYEKRIIQQALIEIAMDYPDEVAEHALQVSNRVDDDTEWEQTNLYLPQDVRSRFNDVFFGQLKVEHDELYSIMKRVMQEAAVITGMEHPEEVAERAIEVNEQYEGDN